MALFSVHPTKFDRVVADEVAAHTNPAIEEAAEIITWSADPHVVCLAAAAGGFIAETRPRGSV